MLLSYILICQSLPWLADSYPYWCEVVLEISSIQFLHISDFICRTSIKMPSKSSLTWMDSKDKDKVQASGLASTIQQRIGTSVEHVVSGSASPIQSFSDLKPIILPWAHLCMSPVCMQLLSHVSFAFSSSLILKIIFSTPILWIFFYFWFCK